MFINFSFFKFFRLFDISIFPFYYIFWISTLLFFRFLDFPNFLLFIDGIFRPFDISIFRLFYFLILSFKPTRPSPAPRYGYYPLQLPYFSSLNISRLMLPSPFGHEKLEWSQSCDGKWRLCWHRSEHSSPSKYFCNLNYMYISQSSTLQRDRLHRPISAHSAPFIYHQPQYSHQKISLGPKMPRKR